MRPAGRNQEWANRFTNISNVTANLRIRMETVQIKSVAIIGAGVMGSKMALAKTIKMVPVETKKEIMGYATNRIWRAIKPEPDYDKPGWLQIEPPWISDSK